MKPLTEEQSVILKVATFNSLFKEGNKSHPINQKTLEFHRDVKLRKLYKKMSNIMISLEDNLNKFIDLDDQEY